MLLLGVSLYQMHYFFCALCILYHALWFPHSVDSGMVLTMPYFGEWKVTRHEKQSPLKHI
jgi:hypothetical protein